MSIRKVKPEPTITDILAAFAYPTSYFCDNGPFKGQWQVSVRGYLTDAQRDLFINLIIAAQRSNNGNK
jgi:hypothetical protein